MSGLYLHIPYCKQACHYCNFHFSTTLHHREGMINAIVEELKLRRAELPDKPLNSIYLGGGTPSLLTADELNRIFQQIQNLFNISDDAEVTLEANPDDRKKSNNSGLPLSIGLVSVFNLFPKLIFGL